MCDSQCYSEVSCLHVVVDQRELDKIELWPVDDESDKKELMHMDSDG